MLRDTGHQDILEHVVEDLELSSTARADVISVVKITEDGLSLSYQHHVLKTRMEGQNRYSVTGTRTMPLTEELKAVIQAHLMQDFWSRVRVRISAQTKAPVVAGPTPAPVSKRNKKDPSDEDLLSQLGL